MKKYVIAIAMMLILGMNAEAASQKHRHTPKTEVVDSTQNNHDAIEAFSDTTATDSSDSADEERYVTYHSIDDEDKAFVKDVLKDISGPALVGLMIPLVAIAGSIIMIPLLLFIIFYFVNKNRREKYKLAQMAIQNGQPIPVEFLKEKQDKWEKSDYNSGLRQMFTGIGLAIFLGIAAGDIGFGIGALIFFIGLGKWFIARQSRNDNDNFMNRNNSHNNPNIQNYE